MCGECSGRLNSGIGLLVRVVLEWPHNKSTVHVQPKKEIVDEQQKKNAGDDPMAALQKLMLDQAASSSSSSGSAQQELACAPASQRTAVCYPRVP